MKVFFEHYQSLMQDFIDGVGKDHFRYYADGLTEILYQKFDVEDQHLAIDNGWAGVEAYYKKSVIPHKIEVFKAGLSLIETLQLGLWDSHLFKERLTFHDFSKFSVEEHLGYAHYNFGGENSDRAKTNFQRAWHHHKMNNDHHPEHWWSVGRDGALELVLMPRIAAIEMVADWMGAGATYGSSLEEWLPKNIWTFRFHPVTAKMLPFILGRVTGMEFIASGNIVELKKSIEDERRKI